MEREYNYIREGMSTSIVRGSSHSYIPRSGPHRPLNRKGKDYTYLYGQTVGAGSLTPYIDSAFDSRVDE